MQYIVHKRFKNKAICGDVNLHAMTKCESNGDFITYNGLPICYIKSENAHQFFAIDEDGMGMLRGGLTRAIQKTLANRDDDYQRRWERVWNDKVCQHYKREDYDDYWLWNHEFFNADIDTLKYIALLINTKQT